MASAGDWDTDAISILWDAAVTEYLKDTGRPKSSTSTAAWPKITSIDELLARIEGSGKAFQDFRSKRSRLWGKLKSFSGPLTATSQLVPTSVIDGFGVPASAIMGAVVYLIQVRVHAPSAIVHESTFY